ncbi:MAG: cupin domain-containing protein [Dermatophilaceae bacterium]
MTPGPIAPEPADDVVRGLGSFVSTDRRTFADRHWGRTPLLSKAGDLPPPTHGFDADAVDELLGARGLRTPFIRMARNGRTLDAADLTLGGGVGASIADQVSEDKVLRLFADGATIVLQGLHRTWAPVTRTAYDLAADLGHPVQVNAYITPPQNQGFADHYDVHDVFVVQVSGEKRWRVRPPVLEAPLRTQPWTDRRDLVERAVSSPPAVDQVLRPGDCLYLPRGWLHSAAALGGTSIHLTFGVHVWTVRHLLDDLVRAAAAHLDDDPAARASLPLGADTADPALTAGARDTVRRLLDSALDAVTDDELARLLAARGRTAQRPGELGVLRQHAAAADAGSSERRWHVRAHLAPRWEGDSLVTRAGRVVVESEPHRTQVAMVLRGEAPLSVLDPGLRRRLVLAGILVPDP